MYLTHYHLDEKPFQISPDPRFLWLGETHKEALATLKYGIIDNRGLVLLVGDVGTGKTTLINALLNDLDQNTIVATILDPGLEELDFYNFLANEFHLNKKFDSKGDFLVHFIHFLHSSHKNNKKVLLIIDESQRLTHDMLEEIRLLSNIGRQDEKLINIFLVGQNELNEKLAESRNRALLQRITLSHNIHPLNKNEVGDYIRFRLRIAGTEHKIFSSSAIREIISFSKCYPRLINIICDRALLTGFTRGKTKINAAIVKECVKELKLLKETWKHRKKAGAIGRMARSVSQWFFSRPVLGSVVIGCLVLIIVGAGYFYFSSKQNDRVLKDKPSESLSLNSAKRPPSIPAAPAEKSAVEAVSEPYSDKEAMGPPESENQPVQVKKIPPPPLPEEKFIVNFSQDSNEMSPETYQLLNQLVDIALLNPGTEIIISGYTDSTGGYRYNKQLSLFRANVVKNYFVGQGLDASKIKTYGRGPENPVASNESPEGRMANRRVEIALKAGLQP